MSGNALDAATLDGSATLSSDAELPVILLTVLAHPEARRVGESARLDSLRSGLGGVEVSRVAPFFGRPDAANAPLTSPFVSRKPLTLKRSRRGWSIDPGAMGGVVVDGQVLSSELPVDAARLDAGVVIGVGSHVALLWHREPNSVPSSSDLGFLGQTAAVRTLRTRVLQLADAPGPVLIRGETGTGKELVATALHRFGSRRAGPFVAVNMAAIPPSLAASTLFGHAKGAFSGASEAHTGHFLMADRGTLFLDEVGDTPDELQTAMLRALETGEIQPVGRKRPQKVDVRVVAATDADLEAGMQSGTFRAPLYYRIATHELHVPPLRARRADIARLLVHFLSAELEPIGKQRLLTAELTERKVWLDAAVVARICVYDWPGNVRQLRNVARYLAGAALSEQRIRPDDAGLNRLMPGRLASAPSASAGVAAPTAPWAAPSAKLRPRDITPDQLESTLEALDWELGKAASHFGVSRVALNGLVDAHDNLCRAKFLTDEQLAAGKALAEEQGVPMWRALRVSKRSLAIRLNAST